MKFWNRKSDEVKPLTSLPKLKMYARECTRIMTGSDEERTMGGDLAGMMIDISLTMREQHQHTLRLVGLDPRRGESTFAGDAALLAERRARITIKVNLSFPQNK